MSQNTISFSVGIPAYKDRFLKECIESVLAQTYKRFELIIVNDCSPNSIEEVVSRFNDSRIKYYKNEKNFGAERVVLNWNRCVEKASNDFFVLLGDDDVIAPNYLEEFCNLIQKFSELDVFHCRSKLIDEFSQPFMLTPSWPQYESVYDNIWHRIKGHRIQFVSDFVYRTSALKDIGGFLYLPLAWGTDDITAYMVCGKKGIAHTNAPLLNYRSSRYTISSTGNFDQKMKAINLQEKWFYDFLKESPANSIDIIIYKDLLSSIKHYIKKRKILTISSSLNSNFFKAFVERFYGRKKSGYNIKDLLIASLAFYKQKVKVKES